MDIVDRLRIRVEPFPVLFWALDIVLAKTGSFPPARHHSTAVQKASPYLVIVGSILNEDALPPPLLLSRYVTGLSTIWGPAALPKIVHHINYV